MSPPTRISRICLTSFGISTEPSCNIPKSVQILGAADCVVTREKSALTSLPKCQLLSPRLCQFWDATFVVTGRPHLPLRRLDPLIKRAHEPPLVFELAALSPPLIHHTSIAKSHLSRFVCTVLYLQDIDSPPSQDIFPRALGISHLDTSTPHYRHLLPQKHIDRLEALLDLGLRF